MDGSGNACEQEAPTPHGTVCNGQQALPPPPPSPQKGYIHSRGSVGGCKTAAMFFDGDGIHRLANTEIKYLFSQGLKAICLPWC